MKYRFEQFTMPARILGLIMVLGVGVLFLIGSRGAQLTGFFIYMSFACTVIPLPTPPYVVAMGKTFHPALVALLGATGNCMAAFGEYYFITWLFSKGEIQARIENNRIFRRLKHFFNRAAFICLVITGFTPIPFEPFRLAAIVSRYSLVLYLLAVFIGRFPRYYLIAKIGHIYEIPVYLLVILVFVMAGISLISMWAGKKTSV
jgi:membrane protein YqaA with SNARE-associated domain